MQIAVNTRLLLSNKLEGIGWFSFETLRRIVQNHPEHQFYFLFDRQFSPEFIFGPNVTPVVLGPQSRHPLLWYIWFEFSVARFLKKNNIDLFISPDGYLPLTTKVPTIAVIHDINFAHHPQGLPKLTAWYYNYFFPKFAHKATRIVTVSEYSKTDIVETYSVAPHKVIVAYNGANSDYMPLDGKQIAEVRRELTGGSPYFMFVGAFSPRKNVVGLLQAFDQFRMQHVDGFKLVLVGERLFKTNDMERAYKSMTFKEDVVFTGRLNVERLKLVMGAAAGLVFVPFFEGFGIPLLEAMRCNVPIVSSNKTSMPEVTGEAALLVDPYNIKEIASAMVYLVETEGLAEELAVKGMARSKHFSWDITAQKLWEAVEIVDKQRSETNA